MERPTHPSRAEDLFGSGKHGFKDRGAPGIGGTRPTRGWFNAVTQELCNIVENSGQTPTVDVYDQVVRALRQQDVAQSIGLLAVSNAATISSGKAVHAVAWGKPDAGNTKTSTLAVGADGTLMVAEDGFFTFAALTPADSFADDFYAATYVDQDNGFLACGESGVIQKIAGAAYTVTEVFDGTASVFRGIAYSPTLERVVAVAQSGVIRTAELADLTTWASRTAGSSYSGDFRSVIWDATRALFIAVGTGGEIQTSADGITWTRRNTDAGGTLNSVASNALGCVAVRVGSESGTAVLRSEDGITWETVETDPGMSSYHVGGEVISVNGVFLTPERTYSTNGVYMSADGGVSWKLRLQPQVHSFVTAAPLGHLMHDGRRVYFADAGGALCLGSIPGMMI